VALAVHAAPRQDGRGAGTQLRLFERQGALEHETPALHIELGIELRNVDVAGREADPSIRYGRGNWRQLEPRGCSTRDSGSSTMRPRKITRSDR